MAYDTAILQGSFTGTGNNVTIQLPSDVDWMWTYNMTELAATNNTTVQAYWQRNMPPTTNSGINYSKTGGTDALTATLYGQNLGFVYVDSSVPQNGTAVATTGVSNTTQPVVSTASTAGLAAGDVVRLVSLDNNLVNISGMDFEITTIVANTSFKMAATLKNAPGAAATTGYWIKINYPSLFYPASRYVCNITQAAQPTVTTTVSHGLTVGQKVSFRVDSDFGMVEIDGLYGTVLSTPTSLTFTIDIDTSAFTAFKFPVAAAGLRLTFAQMIPVGENTGEALTAGTDILGDSVYNISYKGLILIGGQGHPGGALNDSIFWVAGKSFSVATTV